MRRVRAPHGDEGVALLFVVVAMLILASLSVLTLGAIIGQVGPATYQRKAVQTLNASQAGLNAGLAAIREATYVETQGGVSVTYGDRSKVPCWSAHPGSIQAPQGGTTLTYSVTIRYFKSDPTQQTAAWQTLNAMPCVTGIGTTTTPGYALITSQASGPGLPNLPSASGNRVLQGTYDINLTNPHLPGGLLTDSSGLCYAGGLVAGTGVTLDTCTPGADEQMWSYNNTYQLVLVATKAADGSGGLCLAAPPLTPTSNPVAVLMKVCDSTDNSQRWGVKPNTPVHFFGHLSGVYAKTWCLLPATTGAVGGAAVADSNACGSNSQGIIADAPVGAGAAGTVLKNASDVSGKPFQWVNYQEFGRCMDINNANVNAAFHPIYPCKQDPMAPTTSAAAPGWNEVFTWNSTSQYMYVNVPTPLKPIAPSGPSDPAYCMQSPNSVGGMVTFATACASITAATRAPYLWTVNRDTGNYATSYTIVDSYGRCVANGPIQAGDTHSSIITDTCDGSDGQKWNAPPGFGQATLTGVVEVLPTAPS